MLDGSDGPSRPTELNRSARFKPDALSRRVAFGIGLALLVVLAGLAGFLIGRGQLLIAGQWLPGTPRAQAAQFLPFWEAWLKIARLFYSQTPLDPTVMTYGAITGMLDSLPDPYAGFSNPPEHRMENDTFAGEFGGIGAWLARDEQGTYIDSVLPGSSAEHAGLRTGDRLLVVGEENVAMTELRNSALLIRGPVPSVVHLVIERSGAELPLDVPRLVVESPSVTWQMIALRVGYIRIQDLTGRTAAEFATALAGLRALGARALLLDVRDNGGGLPSAAAAVLSQLVSGSIAYREHQPDGAENRVVIPFAASPPESMPLAVWVNGATASAAEIVAAAIQDYRRGPLIGTKTYGKGSVQSLFTLKDGSSVRITTARWLTPLGKPIEGVGLQPDLPTQSDEESLSLAARYFDDQAGIAVEALSVPPLVDNGGKVLV